MCDRPNFEEMTKELDDKLIDLWKTWNFNTLSIIDEDNLGSKEEQIELFLEDCKNRLEDVL